jgi:aspartate kinase
MAIIVQKYGGKSLATPQLMKDVVKRILKHRKPADQLVIVVSAMGSTTDNLISKSQQITDHATPREMDVLLSIGEIESTALMAMAFENEGIPAISFNGPQAGIVTDERHTQSKLLRINAKRVLDELNNGKVVIVAGFQGVSPEGDITTLGRGGSDLTAVALAAALKADVCEKYTDEIGVFTANPKLVKDARKIDVISYDEMIEMTSLGAKVLQARSVIFAKKNNVNIRVRSSMIEDEGTLITKEAKNMEKATVAYIIPSKNEAKITISGVPDKPGIAAKVFSQLAENEVSVDMIIQNVSEQGKTDITFTVEQNRLKDALKVTNGLKEVIKARSVKGDDKIGKISVVGLGMRSAPGVASSMFEALSAKGINIEMISTSEIRISCIIREDKLDEAVQILHDRFQLGTKKMG